MILALVSALTAGLGASSAAKKQKPVALGASVSINTVLQSAGSPYSLYRFAGRVGSKLACRANRQVGVSLSTDGGAPVPDHRKGGFTERNGDWVSVYDVVLEDGHTYSAFAGVNTTSARHKKRSFRCKAARSSSVTVIP